MSTDVQDRRRLENEQALLAAIVSSSEDAIVSKDLTGIVTSWNGAAERIYGWKSKDIIGRSKSLVIPSDLPNELPWILAEIRAGRRIEHYETRRVRKDGSIFDVAISVSPVKSSNGQIMGAATIVRDITERKFAEKELRRRQDEVEALNTQLRRAMTETHHRVKNNLQVIGAIIEMQLMEYRDKRSVPVEEYKQLKAHIHTLATVHDLLSAKLGESDSAQRISVKAMLDRLLPMLQETAWNKTVRFTIDDAMLTSRACTSLALVLNELVTNALKHGNDQAEVVFRRDGTFAELEVFDDGPGFPEDVHPLKIANMGLELVESLVRADLKGEVDFRNRTEGGGHVVVRIPLHAG